MSQAGGGEAPGGTQWLLRGGKRGRVRRRAQTSRQVDVELAQVAVLRGAVAHTFRGYAVLPGVGLRAIPVASVDLS